jgi:hypothetical protein
MKSQDRAYIAGLIDGDGSIMLQFQKRNGMRFHYRINTCVIIYQDSRYHAVLEEIQKSIKAGYIYKRNDQISELRVEGHKQVAQLLEKIKPFLQFKSKQAELMLIALELLKEKPLSLDSFMKLAKFSDAISESNYTSKQRKYSSSYIIEDLKQLHVIPVTTGSPQCAE